MTDPVSTAVAWMTMFREGERDREFAEAEIEKLYTELTDVQRLTLLVHVSSIANAALEQLEVLTGIPPSDYLQSAAAMPYEDDH